MGEGRMRRAFGAVAGLVVLLAGCGTEQPAAAPTTVTLVETSTISTTVVSTAVSRVSTTMTVTATSDSTDISASTRDACDQMSKAWNVSGLGKLMGSYQAGEKITILELQQALVKFDAPKLEGGELPVIGLTTIKLGVEAIGRKSITELEADDADTVSALMTYEIGICTGAFH